LEQFFRILPIRRSLEAMQECDQAVPVRALRARSKIDSRFQRVLAQTALDLCEPWRIRRGGDNEDEWRGWEQRRSARAKEATALLEQYARWTVDAANTEARAGDRPKAGHRDLWWRQHSAVIALLEIEASFCELGYAWFSATAEYASSVQQERREILGRTRQTLHWIETGAAAAGSASPLELASPQERIREWARRIEVEAAKRLPERAELVIPGRFLRWRSIPAREAFQTAFATYAHAPMSRIVEDYWNGSAKIVREVSRAREIIEYWRDAPQPGTRPDGTNTLFWDACHNAAAMLRQQVQILEATDDLDPKLAEAFRTWTVEGSSALEAAQYGWVVLQRPRARALMKAVLRLQEQKARREAQRGAHWITNLWQRTLEALGIRIPPESILPPVVRRTTLRDTLSLPPAKRELPEIYRLLFRLAPVEDNRFLIGREQELAGLEQALQDWEAGRFAACLVVGARGSGKTSLLNCAAAEIFAGRTLIRGQFRDRALNAAQIDAFLRCLLGLREDADLERTLAAERRVLMIEESERTYLRKVDGFSGVHHLLHLIHRTAATTLWIIVMNDKASRVLDVGAELGRAFSHRINAMSVSCADLETAILERHRLSGLQLEFAPPPAGDPRVSRAKKWMGLQESPQKLFFQSLFQQSEGVFRSAFELWLSSIERLEGETLKIRQPLAPAFNRFRNELAKEDHFTLLAIQEHGSLTQQEVADVTCERPESCDSRLERLLALGLIEFDPEHPGLRVRPEAQRFTNDLLRRVNLT
jgi:hypothetical protein